MKKTIFMAVMMMVSLQMFAQDQIRRPQTQTPAAVPPPLALREISGVVKDAQGQTVIGATVFLKSTKDSIKTATNEDGIFVFRNVKMATFVLTISGVTYKSLVARYKQNDAVKRIVLDPITLKDESTLLNEVKINGTPSIVYKPDTVEYRASDYKVRANSTIDEVLKKMEGVEVGNDGSLSIQGQSVGKAKLNGKTFSGGDVAQAIQSLPADIVDKIQFVDDYGDQAARTGVKDGDPQKILNITTKADKSVGTIGRITAQAGNDDRYNGQLSIQRINGNQQISLIGRLQSTVTGVASSGGGATGRGAGGATGGGGGGSPGTLRTGNPTFTYRDQWAPNLQVISNYGYNFSDNNSVSNSYGQTYSTRGLGTFVRSGTNQANSHGHNASFEMDWDIDKQNYLQVTPTYSYTQSTSTGTNFSDNINNFTKTGFEHQLNNSGSNNVTTTPTYGITVLYQHIFTKPGRNISIQSSITKSNSQTDKDANNRFRYYADTTQNLLLKDSLVHLLNKQSSINTTFRTSITYAEPLSKASRLEFNGQMRRSNNDNVAISDTVLANGQTQQLHRLDNIFNYDFTEYRASLSYRFTATKFNFLLGVAAVPSQLNGTKVNTGTGQDVSTAQSYYRTIPVFRFAYSWSSTERITLNYIGTNTEPQFQQIQPFADRTDPNNVIVGNPTLKPSFSNSLDLVYNNYIANSKLNFSAEIRGTTVSDQITSDLSQIPTLIDLTNPKLGYKSTNQTNYVNLGGSHTVTGQYTIAKQLNDRRYNLNLIGSVSYGYNNAMSNDILYHTTSWKFNERFGPRINPTDNIEFNPYIQYQLNRQFANTTNATGASLQTTSLAVDGRMYFFKTWQINYSASKNFIKGITGGGNQNPFVINGGFEKELGTKRNFVLTFSAFDLLHQNNFIQQTQSPTGITNTISSSKSRYFLFGFRLNLQQWSGRASRNGRDMQRRGDGSFIY
ncbi:MAG: TonB-dependent receptor [Mucilaginibacter sp.]